MSGSRPSATRQGILAGVISFAVVMVPTAVILYAAGEGTIGSVSRSGFGVMAALVLGAAAAGAGYLVAAAYRTDPQRRPGDVWSTWFTGLVVFVIGSWLVPFFVVFVFIDSDHSLADRRVLVYLTWIAGHAFAAWLAFRAAKGLVRHAPT